MKIKIDNSFWLLLSVLVLGTVFRIYNLGKESLWFDELGSVDLAMRPFGTVFFKFHNSPLYFLILKYWIRIWGVSEFSLRSLSVIFGVGSIFLIYKVAELLFDKKTGLFSAFLLSISPVHIFYAQETRNYSLLVFLALLSMFIFIRLLREEHIRLYIYYALVNILLAYTLLHGILVIIGQNLFFFLKGRQKKRWLITQAVVLIFFLLWFVPILYVTFNEPWIKASTSWVPKPTFTTLLETFQTFSYGGESYGGADFHISPEDIKYSKNLFYIFGILFILGLWHHVKIGKNLANSRDHSRVISLLSVWLFLSVLLPFLFSKIFFSLYVIRYIIFALPAFLILVALGMSKIKIRNIQITAIFIITVLTSQALYIYYTHNLKINWKETCSYINANIEEDDVIIVSLAKQVRIFGYYGKNGLRYGREKSLKIDESLDSALVTGGFVYSGSVNRLIGVNNVEQLKQVVDSGNVIRGGGNIWLVLTRWADEVNHAEPIRKYIDNFCQGKDQKHFSGVSVYYYKPYSI